MTSGSRIVKGHNIVRFEQKFNSQTVTTVAQFDPG